jgi:hypothetical protein
MLVFRRELAQVATSVAVLAVADPEPAAAATPVSAPVAAPAVTEPAVAEARLADAMRVGVPHASVGAAPPVGPVRAKHAAE